MVRLGVLIFLHQASIISHSNGLKSPLYNVEAFCMIRNKSEKDDGQTGRAWDTRRTTVVGRNTP